MKLLFCSLLLGLLLQIQCNLVPEKFKAEEIVPDILDCAPEKLLKVDFKGKWMILGNELTPTDVKYPPQIVEWENDPSKLYTLLFIDPDAPSHANPEFRPFLHWLVNDISGKNITNGINTAPYIRSLPPENTGFHRYTYLMFEQSYHVSPTILYPVDKAKLRLKFNIKNYIAKNNLKLVAGNFYKAKFDQSVNESLPDLLKSLNS